MERDPIKDPLPNSLEEVQEDIQYWLSRVGEGEPGSPWEHKVQSRLGALYSRQAYLLRERDLTTGYTADTKTGSVVGNKVFVVHGRNSQARDAIFTLLRSIGLQPIEWSQAVKGTGKPAPYVGEILDTAFSIGDGGQACMRE